MKILITLVFFVLASFEANAQDIYSLISNGEKRVNIYNFQTIEKERLDVSLQHSYFAEGNLEKISSALEAFGFEYDHLNDTLLVVIGFQDWSLTIIGPSTFFIKSSKSTKDLCLRSDGYGNDNYYEYIPSGPHNMEEYYPMMYSGDVNALKDAFSGYEDVLDSSEVALRIVLKDGKVVHPSLVFRY